MPKQSVDARASGITPLMRCQPLKSSSSKGNQAVPSSLACNQKMLVIGALSNDIRATWPASVSAASAADPHSKYAPATRSTDRRSRSRSRPSVGRIGHALIHHIPNRALSRKTEASTAPAAVTTAENRAAPAQ